MTTGLVLLAGGVGKRMERDVPKQLLLIGGKPILLHALEKVERIAEIGQVVVTCPGDYLEQIEALLRNRNLQRFRCVPGGATRQESVYLGLKALAPCDQVVVHEAVRPFVTVEEYRRLLDCPEESAFYGLPIPFTVLKGARWVEDIVPREELVNVQLPQKFPYAKLLAVHEQARAEGRAFTEDAGMYHHYTGEPVRVLPGSEYNIKITYPMDIVLGEVIYRERILRKG